MRRPSRTAALWAAALTISLGACPGAEPDATVPDALADAETSPDPPAPWRPPSLAEQGFEEVRFIVHLHAAFSHDGCDNEGLDAEGRLNWPCVHRMKDSLCAERIGVAFMTDHPANMDRQPFPDLLYAEPDRGDSVVLDDHGEPWAVRYACPPGQGGPDGTVVLVPGFEGTHTMAIGLRRHLSEPSHYRVSVKTDTDPALIASTAADIRSAGGMLTIAHSEQPDLDVETIAAHDIPAMEIYNFHANFDEVLESDVGIAIFALEDFLGGDPIPHPDLVALVMLGTYPEAALAKWREVSAIRPITALAGSDVHENVLIPGFCADTSACDGMAGQWPNLLDFLKVGGNVILSDGERIDSFDRVFRWVQNRAWVRPVLSTLDAVEEAIELGRNVVVFEVLGDAEGIVFVATTGPEGDRTVHPMGATLGAQEGATLWARSPDLPVPGSNARWESGAGAELRTELIRTDAGGVHLVAAWEEPGAWRELPLAVPGSYHLEVSVVPRHLEAELGPQAELAHDSYRWVVTNAIRVE